MAKKIQTTHIQFMQIVDYLRKNKQWFLDTRPSNTEAATRISEALKFPLSSHAIAGAKQASGVYWMVRRSDYRGEPKFSAFNAVMSLTTAINRLYERLGEDKPEGLVSLLEYQKNRNT